MRIWDGATAEDLAPQSAMIFSFGQSQEERIEVDVLDYERAPVGEYWDDNWLNVEIRVRRRARVG